MQQPQVFVGIVLFSVAAITAFLSLRVKNLAKKLAISSISRKKNKPPTK
jgi:hypothetical protein